MTLRSSQLAIVPSEQPSSRTELVPHLVSIAKAVRQLVGIKLAEFEVAPGQDQFLLCFENDAARSSVEVADALSVRASTVSKMADILERKGWIVRSPNAYDARKTMLSLTAAGQEVRDGVRDIWLGIEVEIAPMLSNRAEALKVLSEIDMALDRRLRRLR
jgi:DNA-binding MarR family transcriptional regulator